MSVVADPASGVAVVVGGGNGADRTVDKVILVQVIGREGAICSPGECRTRQAYAVRDLGRIEAVRRAAGDLHDRTCSASAGGG